MDNVTHSLFALTVAQTGLRRAGPGTTAAIVIASNAPDIDIVTAIADGSLRYLEMHRGPTHGPIGVVALGLATAALVALFVRGARLGRLSLACIAAVAFHVCMDLPTSYGTRLLSPFSSSWFALDLLPIIDVYLLGWLVAGLAVMVFQPGWRPRIASVLLAGMAANYAVRAVLHWEAVRQPDLASLADIVECDHGPLARWPGDGSQALVDTTCVAVTPTFASPFRWRQIRRTPNAYELRDIDLMGRTVSAPLVVSNDKGQAVERARSTESVRVLLGFSRFPAARVVVDDRGAAVGVRWDDMRFSGGVNSVRGTPPGRRGMFSVTVPVDDLPAQNGRD